MKNTTKTQPSKPNNDTFLNSGLPQFTEKTDFTDFSKDDIKVIVNQVKKFDNYYRKGWKESETRKNLVNFVNEWCNVYRCNSLIIK